MAMRYWAIRPKTAHNLVRIEKANSAFEAYTLAFGRGGSGVGMDFKDMGTRVAVLQSDNKRIAMLTDPDGWKQLTRND